MSILACLIVKNEATTISRCLDAASLVADQALIIDTGSDDDTIATIDNHPMSTIVLERPWINFGHNRSELLAEAKHKADWLLLLDADQQLVADTPLPEVDTDAYTIRHVGGWEYDNPLLLRGDLTWWFEAPTHEYLMCERSYRRYPSGWQIIHHADGGSRHNKFERDYQLLSQHHLEHPDDARTVFYLARTCEDMGKTVEAVAWYELRSTMSDTWEEERWWAQYRRAYLVSFTDPHRGIGLLFTAWDARPWRAEPLARIAKIADHYGWRSLAEQVRIIWAGCDRRDDILFVEAALFPQGV